MHITQWASQSGTLVVKDLPANVGDLRDVGLALGLDNPWRDPGNSLQYSCLENAMN